MSDPFVDTDVIIRLLGKDDPRKQSEAAVLFEAVEAGKMQVAAPVTVIADAVYVLSSPRLYNISRADIREQLSTLVRLPGFKVQSRRSVLSALEIYANTKLDFGDAMIVATMEENSSDILYSYDKHFDRIPNISRRVPNAV
ncbi:MAG: PIN domain-containing protein [Dehalococcoidia bacterium]|nr:PIN domain-containing protein [Dehalococcoidia bacterium]